MNLGVKVMGMIDIIAGVVILLGNSWIGFDVIAVALLIKGFVSLAS